jgi:hypothetical protein
LKLGTISHKHRIAMWCAGAVLILAAGVAGSLALMGRVWWCEAGDLQPWSWDVWSPHNSQHLIDPYTLSHFQHGIGLYCLLLVLLKSRTTICTRTLVVALVEAAWEVAENTEWMIQRYRAETISLDYYGDSILNSVSDYAACIVGVLIAQRLPLWASAVIFAGLEIASVWWIRDSLLLNGLMLLWPIEAIRRWQMGG